jgi:hypothetical protein
MKLYSSSCISLKQLTKQFKTHIADKVVFYSCLRKDFATLLQNQKSFPSADGNEAPQSVNFVDFGVIFSMETRN